MRYATELPRTADLVVIGGGIAGASTAFHGARAGLRTVLLEARRALCTLTTPVAAGAFRLQFEDLDELRLVREAVDLFLHFQEATGQGRYDAQVRERGYLWLATTGAMAERQRRLVEHLHRWGQTDVEIVDGDGVRDRFPFVGPDVIQARWRAGDGFVDTKQLTFGLAEGSNADVVLDCRVTGLAVQSGRVREVRTSRGAVSAGAVVVACGPFSGHVAGLAGIALPVEAVRRHKLWMPGLEAVSPEDPMIIHEETGAHWRPAFGGAWVLWTDPSTPASEPDESVAPDPSFAFDVLDPSSPAAVARVAPFWRQVWEHGAHHWVVQAGQYTVTPDHRPLLGATGVEGLHVNTGYSGHGIMLGPAGSRVVVDLITGAMDPAANAFAPDRDFAARELPTL
jgi:glycine/D-amino acid oxidase-like deaminating enzyme